MVWHQPVEIQTTQQRRYELTPEWGHQRRKLYLIRAFGTASTLDGYR